MLVREVKGLGHPKDLQHASLDNDGQAGQLILSKACRGNSAVVGKVCKNTKRQRLSPIIPKLEVATAIKIFP